MPDIESLTSSETDEVILGRFLELLERHGVHVEERSPLYHGYCAVQRKAARAREGRAGDLRDMRGELAQSFAATSLAYRALAAYDLLGNFVPFESHLRLLSSGVPSPSGRVRRAQLHDDPHPVPSDSKEASDRIWELHVALASALVGSNVDMPPPRGGLCDITCQIDDVFHGFECKSVEPFASEQDDIRKAPGIAEHLEKASKQISSSGARAGCAVVDFTRMLDPEEFMPASFDWPRTRYLGTNNSHILNLVRARQDSIVSEVRKNFQSRNVPDSFASRGFIFFAQVVYFNDQSGRIIPAMLNYSQYCYLGRVLHDAPNGVGD